MNTILKTWGGYTLVVTCLAICLVVTFLAGKSFLADKPAFEAGQTASNKASVQQTGN